MKSKAKLRRQSQSTKPKSSRKSQHSSRIIMCQGVESEVSWEFSNRREPQPPDKGPEPRYLLSSVPTFTGSVVSYSNEKAETTIVSETEIDDLLFSSSVQEEESVKSVSTDKSQYHNKTKNKIDKHKEIGAYDEFSLFTKNFLKTWRLFFGMVYKLLKFVLVLLLSFLPKAIDKLARFSNLFAGALPISTQILISLIKVTFTGYSW